MPAPISQRHAFLSYVHEDKTNVDLLQQHLEAGGVQVWRDTQDLWPGEDWQAKIRAAIKSDSLAFIACFSSATATREKSYQNEELRLAVEEYRLRPPGRSWLFTVRFDECEIPAFPLGPGQTLDTTIQRVDLFGDGATRQTIRLLQSVQSVMNPAGVETVSTEAVRSAKKAEGADRERSDLMKTLLRDPDADIRLDDLMQGVGQEARDQFSDPNAFPTTLQDETWSALATVWVEHIHQYEKGLQPCLELVRLAGGYGLARHNGAWRRFMGLFASLVGQQTSTTALANLRGYPALVVMYVATLASISRDNFTPLNGFLVEPTTRDPYRPGDRIPLLVEVDTTSVAQQMNPIATALAMSDEGRDIDGSLIEGLVQQTVSSRYTPMSDHLHHLLRDLFADDFVDDDDYAETFDRAEVILDALAFDAAAADNRYPRGSLGRYTWRQKTRPVAVEKQLLDELLHAGKGWSPLIAGLFGGSTERATAALEKVAEHASRQRQSQWP
ncbi:toll/interleukin-1 receptor domain-containing protein [Microbacterium sp. X-17]|uniref:toll/interleukin-1 receptor domain-containing protein n=1 Tax=Microbacterium sp. X-17 TaxID=3144404 RepID=UPI0031F507CA